MASQYPDAIDDQSTLYNPADSFSTKPLLTTLGASCLDTDATIQMAATLASLGARAAYGILSIDDEQILYTGSSGFNATGCIRGAFGTTAIGHAMGAAVRWRYVAAFDQALQSAVVAIQTTLGVTGAFNFLAASPNLTYDDAAQLLELLCTVTSVPRGISVKQISDDNAAPNLQGNKARGTPGSEAAVASGTNLLVLLGKGFDGSAYRDGGFIRVTAGETWDGSHRGCYIDIYTIASGATAQSHRVRIGMDGIVDLLAGLKIASGQSITSVTTSVGAVGADTALATEQGVREAISPGVNAQIGTSYTYQDSDRGKLVTHSNGSAIAGALPQAGASSLFVSGWFCDIENRGAGTLTITPATSTIDGASSFVLATNQGVRIFSDGSNYFTQRGVAGGSGSVTTLSVVSANGLAGSVANPTTTPAITLTTTVTGLLKGNGTAISAATAGTDYAPATAVDTVFSDVSDASASATTETTLSSIGLSGPTNGTGYRIRCHVLVTGDTTYSFAVRLKVGGTTVASYNAAWVGTDFQILFDVVVMGISSSAAQASVQQTNTGGVSLDTVSLTSLSNANVDVTFEPTALSDATTGICKMLLVERLRPAIHAE